MRPRSPCAPAGTKDKHTTASKTVRNIVEYLLISFLLCVSRPRSEVKVKRPYVRGSSLLYSQSIPRSRFWIKDEKRDEGVQPSSPFFLTPTPSRSGYLLAVAPPLRCLSRKSRMAL